MSLPAPPCPHLWTPDCECPLGPFHRPACAWFDPGLDPADYGPSELGCPPEHGCLGDEYDWLLPNGPEDPDRSWAERDSGE